MHGYDLTPNLYTTAFMGVDIGFGSSDTALVVCRVENGVSCMSSRKCSSC